MTREFVRSPFVTSSIAMLIVLGYPLLFFSKGELLMLINENHTTFQDIFFKYITYLGDGMVMAVILLILLFYSYKWSILTVFSIIFQSIIVSIFKRWLFEGLQRPTAFLQNVEWHFVEGVDVHSSNTFPSGHTTTGFALFSLLVIVFNNRSYLLSLLFFILAFLVGLSRVYLLQHFVVDAYFGAIIGILSVILSLFLMDRIFTKQKLLALHQRSLSKIFIGK
jgi:membrane-associated phospholipid phosphatase